MNKKILSVNGNKSIQYLLQTIFENEFDLVPAMDAYKGLHLLRTAQNIELLIIDVDFNTDECWEMIHHVKTSRLFQIPVIVLTSSNNDTVKNKCYELGIDEVFFKPFNPTDLMAAVKTLNTAPIL